MHYKPQAMNISLNFKNCCFPLGSDNNCIDRISEDSNQIVQQQDAAIYEQGESIMVLFPVQ